jgi:hypothetical protein
MQPSLRADYLKIKIVPNQNMFLGLVSFQFYMILVRFHIISDNPHSG